MQNEPHEIVLATLSQCLRVGNRRWLWIDALRERAARHGMRATYRTWDTRASEWFNTERRHHLPPYAIDEAIQVIGSAEFLDPWLALEQRARRMQRAGVVDNDRSLRRRA